MIGCEWEKKANEVKTISKTKRLWDFLVVGLETNYLYSFDRKNVGFIRPINVLKILFQI